MGLPGSDALSSLAKFKRQGKVLSLVQLLKLIIREMFVRPGNGFYLSADVPCGLSAGAK